MKALTLRTGAALITAGMLASPVAAFDMTDMNDAERQAFRSEIRDYLLDNPEVLMEAIGVLEQRQAQAQAQSDSDLVAANADAIFADGKSWTGGNPDGDVTMVEFLDYRCGYCKRAFQEVEDLIADDGNIRFIIKEFPILGPESVQASRFAIAVRKLHGDDSYKGIHDALFQMRGEVSDTSLKRVAEDAGLDAEAIFAAMDDEDVTAEIRDNHALAEQLSISGTPTFILDDEMLRGYVPLAQMQELVAATRAE